MLFSLSVQGEDAIVLGKGPQVPRLLPDATLPRSTSVHPQTVVVDTPAVPEVAPATGFEVASPAPYMSALPPISLDVGPPVDKFVSPVVTVGLAEPFPRVAVAAPADGWKVSFVYIACMPPSPYLRRLIG